MNRWLSLFAALSLAGCTHFESRPMAPEKTAAQLDARRLDDAGLRRFLEQNYGHDLNIWPIESWDLTALAYAAFYFQPNLEVARAQWRVAQAGEKTAGGRPNPTLSVTPGYNTTTLTPSPWFPSVNFDLPLETAGKRGQRIAAAQALASSARWNLVTAAWQARSSVRAALLDLAIARQRAALLEKQLATQQQIVKRLRQRYDAGAIARPELTLAQIACNKTQIDDTDAAAKSVEARSRLAEAIGLSTAALAGVEVAYDFSRTAPADLTSAEARRGALQSRSDILGALADYAASEADLRLEIAKQYPDVHVNPGYQYDMGDNKWSVGISLDLPLLNQNQGPIAEAEARRKLAAAKFTALQAKAIGEIDRAVAGYEMAQKQWQAGNALLAAQQQQQQAAEAQLKAGAADPLEALNAQLEWFSASLVQLENAAQGQRALGALEDAVQRPAEAITAAELKLSQTPAGAKTGSH
ncbi:MAG: TolC family protein [Verrucomicrobiota bacterium]